MGTPWIVDEELFFQILLHLVNDLALCGSPEPLIPNDATFEVKFENWTTMII
jgi:hypothetical protein